MSKRVIDKPLIYYIPWWDDLVDLRYDFINDAPTDGVKATSHQLYKAAPYDGILASKTKIEDNKTNMARIEQVGIHKYLGFDGPVFGDCGAFNYIKKDEPPISTEEITDYYHRIGFDYGVSIDHLIVKATEDQKHFRYDLTLKNAEKFIQRHQSKGYDYVPVGAAQGWNPASYKSAAESLIDMGYEYIAVSGLTRSQTPIVLAALTGVQEAIQKSKKKIKVHLFGVARLNAIGDLLRLGVTSFDSASHLRRAWLGAGSNYILPGGKGYATLRVPQWNRSPRAKAILEEGRMTEDELRTMDEACMDLIRMYDKDEADIDEVLEAVLWYDSVMGDKRDHADAYLKTLRDRPWKKCPCAICKKAGVEVIIFRGNNRNRRRGFHNTQVFYNELQHVIKEEVAGGDQTQLTDFM